MDKDEITALAAGQGVFPVTLYRDYAVTILLSVISGFSGIKSSMSFKGGTAIKKIYFQEIRFSEDLDFTCSKDVSGQLFKLIEKAIKDDDLDVNFTEVNHYQTGPIASSCFLDLFEISTGVTSRSSCGTAVHWDCHGMAA